MLIYLGLLMFMAHRPKPDPESVTNKSESPDPAIVVEDGTTILVEKEDIDHCYV